MFLTYSVKREFIAGNYKKETSLYNGKCHWSHIADKDCGIWYNKEINVWEIGLGHNEIAPKKFDINDGYGYIRTVQDGPCPTVANTFEYRNIGWKPAPINSVIIKCAK